MDVWYLISNSNTIVFSFEQLRIKKNRFITMVDKIDIDRINEKENSYINVENFSKCIAYFDPMEEKNSEWWDSLETVLHIHIYKLWCSITGKKIWGRGLKNKLGT